ncbi:hypothetical protein E1B28_013121 [Marasmius oreades]|uniref:DUF6535 domain-containing protein n=1 Tax=Marasmius oreades TaxID=181124 RepID=A0A9P7RPX8_9AGAR|nr:uncharacterized protein E1B28_013121 [Marasmius oreades]KAG7087141.1 hypothetical protein E1B28_013121 [Marasmius oreades]
MTSVHSEISPKFDMNKGPDSFEDVPTFPAPFTPATSYKYNVPHLGDYWKECLKKVDHSDVESCNGWREDIDTLLVFAGLFSAVVTAFTVESYQWLDTNPQDTTALILLHIVQNSNFTTPLPSTIETQFSAPPSAVRINVCWFLSLTMSLTAVIIGILCKQWIREHRRNPPKYTSHKDTLLLRQMRHESFQRWGVSGMAHCLPLLLEVALVLFFLGVLDLLWSLNTVVASIITVQVGLAILVITATTVLPTLSLVWTLSVPCAYKSPQAWLFYRFCDSVLPRTSLYLPFWDTRFNILYRGLTDWFDSDTSHPSFLTRDIDYSLVQSTMDRMNEAFGASREVSLHIFHCLADYSHFQGSYLPRTLRKLSDVKRYQILTRYHEWYWWDDHTRRHMVELLLRAVNDPTTSGEDITIALDRLGRIAVALTTASEDKNIPLDQHPHTADADPKRFRNLGEDLLLRVFSTLNEFSLSDRANTTQFLACYSILNRYWLRITEEWPDRLGHPGWHQPTSFLRLLHDFVSQAPEKYRISRITKCVVLLDSIVMQPHTSFAVGGSVMEEFVKMLDKRIFNWGIGPSLVHIQSGMGEKSGVMPWRDLYNNVLRDKKGTKM